jgi:hypothetical protein
MSLILLSLLVASLLGRSAWALYRLWRALPRRNADFALF